MATEQSPEAKELSLVGKVEMRIALADGDQKLQATLNTYLAPLLLKLASEHMSVRNKVCDTNLADIYTLLLGQWKLRISD